MLESATFTVRCESFLMHFRDERTGNASGFAVECLGIVAKRAGFTVTYKFGHNFAEIIGKLRTGEVDILPSLAVSEERRKTVDFTEPLASSATMLFVRGRDTSITGLRSGLRIGVVQGSIMQEKLKNNQDILLISYPGFSEALFDLLAGQIDGLVSSESTIWGMARDAGVEDKIKTVGPSMGEVIRSMAARKGNTRLLDMLNRAAPSLGAGWLGLMTSIFILVGFALPPLLQLRSVPPARVLRRNIEPPPLRYATVYGTALAALLALLGWLVRDAQLLFYVSAATLGTFAVLILAGWLLVRSLGVLRGSVGVSWRYGMPNIARRGRDSVVQIVAFGLGIMVLLLLAVVRNDLMQEWRASLSQDAPNYFMINIRR